MDDNLFSARLEALISAALQDGILTDQELAIIRKRAEKEEEDPDEVEMILKARLEVMQSNVKPINNTNEKSAIVKEHNLEINSTTKPTLPKPSVPKEKKEGNHLWWVNDLDIKFDGKKYALVYTGKQGHKTGFIYDNVEVLNEYQARLTQMQPDGSFRYGVACTCGWKFYIVECDYKKVTFLDGIGAVLAIDEEDDEYAIDRWGSVYSLNAYRRK